MKHAFIVTYGRSGSTLLAGLLNAYPHVVIRGENFNALFQSWRAANGLAYAARVHGVKKSAGTVNPWFGIASADIEGYEAAIATAFSNHVLRPPPGTRVLGFKEIRYGLEEMSDDDLTGFLSFLVRRFEDAVLIFNSRDLAATAKSAWFRGVPNARRYLELSEARLRSAFEQYRDHSVWVSYDKYIADPRALIPILDKLGLPFEESRITATLAEPHSYSVTVPPARSAISERESSFARVLADYERHSTRKPHHDTDHSGWLRGLLPKRR